MSNMPMCPMMMANMPMMQMPMMQMPNMQPMNMCIMEYQQDEMDEKYFASMYSDDCHSMMPYILKAVDGMEQKGDMIYEEQPDKEMLNSMIDEAYNNMIKDMPEMAEEKAEERQYYGPRNFARDLIGVLLVNELLGRRRRRRRPYIDVDIYPYPYSYGYDDYYYYD